MKAVIATGGSGGHLFPALQVADELKGLGFEIMLIGSFHLAIDRVERSGYPFKNLKAKGIINQSLIKLISSLWLMMGAIVTSLSELRKYKPDIVIGFGGYGAFPVILASSLLNVPSLIHEQNVIPGRANAMLAPVVRKIAISFKESTRYFNNKNLVLTGCPCHFSEEKKDRSQLADRFELRNNKKTILVFGGSQGSKTINETMIKALQLMQSDDCWQVIHISGKNDFEKLKEEYYKLNIPYALTGFLDDIHSAYRLADVVVSRAGALTVSELALYQLPSILIPYPYANNHQLQNAMVLTRNQLAVIIQEKDLTPEKLVHQIKERIDFKNNWNEFQPTITESETNAAKKLAMVVNEMV